MPPMNLMLPVLPGKEDELRAFAAEILGPRLAEFEALQSEPSGRETWTLMSTPEGSYLLIYFESSNLDADRIHEAMNAKDDFTVWSRTRLLELTGVDVSHRDASGPMPEVIFDWKK